MFSPLSRLSLVSATDFAPRFVHFVSRPRQRSRRSTDKDATNICDSPVAAHVHQDHDYHEGRRIAVLMGCAVHCYCNYPAYAAW